MRPFRQCFRTLAICLCAAGVPAAAGAQTPTLQQNLVGPTSSGFGTATSVDGATAVVGAPLENGSRGAAYVYVRDGTAWSLQQRLQAPVDAMIGFGGAVGLSGDRIVIGATVGAGGAFVFARTGTAWALEATLAASDGATGGFGAAVDIAGDLVIVGAPLVSRPPANQVGAAYVYRRFNAAWAPTRVLAPSAGEGGDQFGAAVGISSAAACVGAPRDDVGGNVDQGSVYVFESSGWTLQQQLNGQAASGAVIGGDDQFGRSCAVDGDTVAVAAPGVDFGAVAPNIGAAFVFTRQGITWSQQRVLTGDVSPSGLSLVALAGDLLVIASPTETPRGAAYLYRRSGVTWTRQQPRLSGNDALGRGFGAGISTDGVSLFAGAPTGNTSTGTPGSAASVYVVGTTLAGVPSAPSGFTATSAGNVVTMSWGAPTSGGAATGYTLIARSGGTVLVSAPLGNVLSFSATAPNGTYALSLRATNASGDGPESPQVTVTLPTPVAAPTPPRNLAASVAGNAVTLTWAPGASGGAPESYLLVAGTTPNFTVPAVTAPLPPTPTATIPGVPTGTYYVRVLAQNGGGISGASNEVSLTVAPLAAPGAPTLNPPVISGTTLTLSWTPGSGSATSYTLRAYTSDGTYLLDVPNLVGTAATFANVPRATFGVELIAVNPAGSSPPSARLTITVP